MLRAGSTPCCDAENGLPFGLKHFHTRDRFALLLEMPNLNRHSGTAHAGHPGRSGSSGRDPEPRRFAGAIGLAQHAFLLKRQYFWIPDSGYAASGMTQRFLSPNPTGSTERRLTLVALQVDPEGANLFLAVVPDAMGTARTVGNEVATLHYVQSPIDLDRKLSFEDEAIFETIVGDWLFGRARMGCVFIERDRNTACAVFLDQPADHMGRGLDHPLLGTADDELLVVHRLIDDEVGHLHAQGIGNDNQRPDRRGGPPALDQAEHRRAQTAGVGEGLQCHVAREPHFANAKPDGRERTRGRPGGIILGVQQGLTHDGRILDHLTGASPTAPSETNSACTALDFDHTKIRE
ncbi:hypothetical protein CHELA20_10617 [Hyphomicrobiales bacterium]|nr:hypothetical protein CHELA20_10617 [Hyphomicrobiales bacterium]CAH1692992.1 hypothetical protein CHELA41_50846 [Hyphomicrobiales bacterium]